MNVKKPLLITGVVSGLGLAVLGATGMASAATNGQADAANPSSSLVNRIATTFNLDKSKVQEVFSAERTEREAERQQRLEQELSQAVEDGKLTEAQKAAILAKQKELKAALERGRESMEDKSRQDRHADMEAKRTELQQWAEDQGIPEEYRHLLMGGRGGPEGRERPGAN